MLSTGKLSTDVLRKLPVNTFSSLLVWEFPIFVFDTNRVYNENRYYQILIRQKRFEYIASRYVYNYRNQRLSTEIKFQMNHHILEELIEVKDDELKYEACLINIRNGQSVNTKEFPSIGDKAPEQIHRLYTQIENRFMS